MWPPALVPLVTLKNDSELEANVAALRKAAKLMGTRIRIYGRCHDKVAAFKQTGRGHSYHSNNNSIYSIKSPEAKFCYEWKVYRYETAEEAAIRERKYFDDMKRDRPEVYEEYYAGR